MRKFTYGQLEIRRLSITDLAWIFIYLTLVLVTIILDRDNYVKEHYGTLFMTAAAVGFLTFQTQLGLRFRSVYFSCIWLIISFYIVDNEFTIMYYPLSVFLLYHIIRIVFWNKYEREFIPFIWNRGWKRSSFSRRVNNIENSGGSVKDLDFTRWLVGLSLVIFFICLWGMIGVKI